MTTPKISYQIEAQATGAVEVGRLAGELDKLGQAIDPSVAARAQALAGAMRDLAAKQQAVEQFTQLRRQVDASRVSMGEAQTQAQQYARALAGMDSPTRAQVGQLEKLRQAVRDAKSELQTKTATLDQARQKLGSYGIASDGVAQAQINLRRALGETSTEARTLTQSYATQATTAQASAATQVRSAGQIREGVASISAQLAKLQQLASVALGGSFVGQLAGDLARIADQYTNVAARIKLVTGEGPAFDRAFEGVFEVATRTNSSLETTANLFVRITQAGKTLNLSQQDALSLTQAINQATQLSGASAQASDAAITQLIQGLQSGVLRGEEFNSVMEQAPRLAQALSDGLGVTTGELRKLAQQGGLTSQEVIRALQGQASALQTEFDKLPKTVGRALTNLGTQWTRYVGETDAAHGASRAAAAAIEALARNLATVAEIAFRAGEAWLAYKAIDIASAILSQAAASNVSAAAAAREVVAVRTATAATTAQTAALAVNTAAKTSNAAATAGLAAAATAQSAAQAGAAAGALAGLGSMLKLGSAVGLAIASGGDLAISTFRRLGTWIGEGAARLAGYRDRVAEVLEQQKSWGNAIAAAKREQDAYAQKLRKTQEEALGLTDQSKAMVAEFGEIIKKGESVSQALDKVGKSLELATPQGIKDAVTALDVLERKGKLTAEQLRNTLGEALKGEDLARFEAQARAAFDQSEQGARRLKAVLETINDEALRRAGTSLRELQTGFSAAATSAINDVDALNKALAAMGKGSNETRALLAGALDKALEAARTEKAIKAVIERLEEMSKQGAITGEAFVAAMDKARGKLDDLQPGINSVTEALRSFGLKTREEMQHTADKLSASYQVISRQVTVSLADKVKAFDAWREAAMAANGGIETSEIKLQRAMLQTQLAAKGHADTMAQGSTEAGVAIDGVTKKISEQRKEVAAVSKEWAAVPVAIAAGISTAEALAADAEAKLEGVRESAIRRALGTDLGVTGGAGIGSLGASASSALRAKTDASSSQLPAWDTHKAETMTPLTDGGVGQLQPPDNTGRWFLDTSRKGEGPWGLGVWTLQPEFAAQEAARAANPQLAAAIELARIGARSALPEGGALGPPSPPTPQERVQTIQINLGGRSATVSADMNNAAALVKLLEEAALRYGGG